FQKKCINRILEFKKQGVTIIFVSHDLSQIEKICDRAAWLDNHSIRIGGTPSEVVKEYLKY
ncbi:ABC transporter ATP-binding protein, partial [bacterium]|nr:ABC transporter ATP-binding protein [bacterium]